MYVNEITDVVNNFVNDNKLFTAYDVTVEVRKKVSGRVPHDEVKREVHKLFNSGSIFGYNRALANLSGVNPQPWVYHPLAADPTTYDGKPVCQNPVAAVASALTPKPPVAAALAVVGDDDDEEVDGVYKFDSTDRLCVPAKLVRQLGLHDGAQVSLLASVPPSDVVMVVDKNAFINGLSEIATYTVDCYDNVRISRGTLSKVGIDGNTFEITGDATTVKVKKRT
jgi:hypothetical protein